MKYTGNFQLGDISYLSFEGNKEEVRMIDIYRDFIYFPTLEVILSFQKLKKAYQLPR